MTSRALALCLCALASSTPMRADPPLSGNARAEAIAQQSAPAKKARDELVRAAATIKDAALRTAVQALLAHPAPTFLARFKDDAARDAVRAELVRVGLLDASVTTSTLFPAAPGASFLAAPGNPPGHHHGHPGGLAQHAAFNLKSALALEAQYRDVYGATIDHDIVVAAPIIHDAFKAWCLQWKDDGTTIDQPKLAGTAAHHPLIVAEAIYRKLPPAFVVALASAHDTDPKVVAGYLVAASIIAGVDPLKYGLVAYNYDGSATLAKPLSFEAAINHLSDHDFILTDPAGERVDQALTTIAARDANGKSAAEQRWWINGTLARVPTLRVYDALLRGGEAGVEALLKAESVDPVGKAR